MLSVPLPGNAGGWPRNNLSHENPRVTTQRAPPPTHKRARRDRAKTAGAGRGALAAAPRSASRLARDVLADDSVLSSRCSRVVASARRAGALERGCAASGRPWGAGGRRAPAHPAHGCGGASEERRASADFRDKPLARLRCARDRPPRGFLGEVVEHSSQRTRRRLRACLHISHENPGEARGRTLRQILAPEARRFALGPLAPWRRAGCRCCGCSPRGRGARLAHLPRTGARPLRRWERGRSRRPSSASGSSQRRRAQARELYPRARAGARGGGARGPAAPL